MNEEKVMEDLKEIKLMLMSITEIVEEYDKAVKTYIKEVN